MKKLNRITKWSGVTERKPPKSRNSFVSFSVVLSLQTLLKWFCFYCFLRLKSKLCLFKGLIVGQLEMKNLYYWTIFWRKLLFALRKDSKQWESSDLLNPKTFHAYKKKKNCPMEAFSTLDVNKDILDLNELKCQLKSVYATYFAKQALSIQKVTEISWTKPNYYV